MTRYFIILVALFLGLLIGGCKKNDPNEIPIRPLASLTITNAISQGKFVRLNSNVVDSCALNNYKIFTIVAGATSPIKAFASSTPNSPYFNQNSEITSGGIYSLYLTGTHSSPEAVFVKDNIPSYPAADVFNVRVVNLSPNAGPLTITLASAPTIIVFSAVGYKQVADFVTLPLPLTVPAGSNIFQIRDAGNNILLSYTLPSTGTVSIASSRHRNVTLAIRGRVGGTGTDALAVLGVPHY